MNKLIGNLLIVFFQISKINLGYADVSEIFDLIKIQVPEGTFFPGDKVKFVCTTSSKLHGGGLDWAFQINGTIYEQIYVDSADDQVESFEEGLKRTSYIRLNPNITGLSCRHKDGSFKKIVNIDLYKKIRVVELDGNYPNLTYPRILLQRDNGGLDIKDQKSLSQFHDITNETVEFYPNIKSFKLLCLHNTNDAEYIWSFSKANPSKPDATDLLNSVALINRMAMATNRYPINCGHKASISFDGLYFESLDVTIPPSKSTNKTTTYFCKSKNGVSSAQTKIMTVGGLIMIGENSTRQAQIIANRTLQQDQEFIELINLVMQILQSSNDSSGGNGPLYGVGFGSSTIMVLMALTIYYLKRQLKQVQEQVKSGEYRQRRKPTRPVEDEDEDL